MGVLLVERVMFVAEMAAVLVVVVGGRPMVAVCVVATTGAAVVVVVGVMASKVVGAVTRGQRHRAMQ